MRKRRSRKRLGRLAILAVFCALAGSAAAGRDRWTFWRSIDPLTDAASVTAGVWSGLIGDQFEAALAFSCFPDAPRRDERDRPTEPEQLFIQVGFGDFDGETFRRVDWRVDDGPAQEQRARNRVKGGAHLEGADAVRVARAFAAARRRIVVRSGDETRVFPVTGSTRAIKRALSACGL